MWTGERCEGSGLDFLVTTIKVSTEQVEYSVSLACYVPMTCAYFLYSGHHWKASKNDIKMG